MKKGILIFSLLLSLQTLYAELYFPIPKFETPSINSPNPSTSLYNSFKNEIIDQAGLNLNIIYPDVQIKGRGLLSLSVQRYYSSKDFYNEKSDTVINNYIDFVWEDYNFSDFIKQLLAYLIYNIAYGGPSNPEYTAAVNQAFDNVLSDDDRKNEFKQMLRNREIMFSLKDFLINDENTFGKQWFILINAFSRIYCNDIYLENFNKFYHMDPSVQTKKYGEWKHNCYVLSENGFYNYHRKTGEQDADSGMIAQDNIGQYLIDLDPKNLIFSFDGSKYIIKTRNGLIYTFEKIKEIINNNYSYSEGQLEEKNIKKIAYLTKIEDKYGYSINILYENSSYPYRITKITGNGIANREVAVLFNANGVISSIQYPGDSGTLSWTYNYNGNKLTSAVDPLTPSGRKTDYEYINNPASHHHDILNKIIYPNKSYTVYEYGRESLDYELELNVIVDMILPHSQRIVAKRTRYDINPSDNQIKNKIESRHLKTAKYKGIKHSDGDEHVDEFEFEKSRVVRSDEVNSLELKYKNTIYEYNNDNLLASIVTPVELDKLDILTTYTYGSFGPLPIQIEEYIAPYMAGPILKKKMINSYDGNYNLDQEKIYISDNPIPEFINDYDYTYNTTSRPGFILNYLHQKRTLNSSSVELKKSRAEFNNYGDLIRLYQRINNNEVLMMRFNYNSSYPYQIESIESRLDDTRWIPTYYQYDTDKRIFITKKWQTINSINLENSFEYNMESGTLKKTTDENGNETTVPSYDTLNRIKEVIHPTGQKFNYYYDDLNNKITIISSNGTKNLTTITNDYNGYGVIEEEKAIDHISGTEYLKNYTYHKTGELKFEILNKNDSVNERITYFEYDLLKRQKKIRFGDGSEIKYSYRYDLDEKNEIAEAENQLGQIDVTYNDFLGRTVKKEKKSKNSSEIYQTKYIYNTLGYLTEVWQNANGSKVLKMYYTYDELGRKLSVQYPYDSTPSEIYEYYYNNALKKATDNQNKETIYNYDNIGRLLSINYPDPVITGNVTYEYDSGTYGKGKLTKVNNSRTGSEEYTYGRYNRLEKTEIYNSLLNRTYEINYHYDIPGNIDYIRIPDNSGYKQIDYTYDGIGMLLQVKTDGDTICQYQYNKLNNIATKHYNNGTLKTEYKYDLVNRVKDIDSYNINTQDKKIFKEQYMYDVGGNRTATITKNKLWYNYEYDPVCNMLTKVKYPSEGDTAYTYDKLFNRTQMQYAYGKMNYYYQNNCNRLDYYTLNNNDAVKIDLDYDYRGNTTNEEFIKQNRTEWQKNLIWDDEDRLVKYEYMMNTRNNTPPMNVIMSNFYNSDGIRIGKRVYHGNEKKEEKYYLYNGDQVIAELNESGEIQNQFIYGNSLIGKIDKNEDLVYYFNDVLGSTRNVTDGDGNTLQSYRYGPFGNIETSHGKENNQYRYTAKEFDTESGLYYYGARYYNGLTGRFISKDPILDVNDIFSLNYYVYCRNNPLKYIDPDGEYSIQKDNNGINYLYGDSQLDYNLSSFLNNFIPFGRSINYTINKTIFGNKFVYSSSIKGNKEIFLDTLIDTVTAGSGKLVSKTGRFFIKTLTQWTRRASLTYLDFKRSQKEDMLNHFLRMSQGSSVSFFDKDPTVVKAYAEYLIYQLSPPQFEQSTYYEKGMQYDSYSDYKNDLINKGPYYWHMYSIYLDWQYGDTKEKIKNIFSK